MTPMKASDSPKNPLEPGAPQGGNGSGPEVDPDLLARFRAGDREAFDAIVTRYQEPLIRFFYRLCWDRDRAEDFAQDVFLRLLRGAATYEPQGKLSTFLYRIATNRWIDHYRSRRPRPRLLSLDAAAHEEDSPLLEGLAAPAPARDPLSAAEDRDRLQAALQRLSMHHRLVFELAVFQNLPYKEVADLLKIPEGTVKSRMHHAVRALKGILNPGESRGGGGARPDRVLA